jgi:hypothetical protein
MTVVGGTTTGLVAWYDGDTRILAREFDSAGSLGVERTVALRISGAEHWPVVAYLTAIAVHAGWAVCWLLLEDPNRVECQPLSAGAIPFGPSSSFPADPDSHFSLCRRGDRYWAAWEEDRGSGGPVYIQPLDEAFAAMGVPAAVYPSSSGSDIESPVLVASDGVFGVAWGYGNAVSAGVQILGSDGSPIGRAPILPDRGYGSSAVRVASAADDTGVTVFWSEPYINRVWSALVTPAGELRVGPEVDMSYFSGLWVAPVGDLLWLVSGDWYVYFFGPGPSRLGAPAAVHVVGALSGWIRAVAAVGAGLAVAVGDTEHNDLALVQCR